MKFRYLMIFICVLIINTTSAQNEDWQWVKRGGGISFITQGSEVFSTGVERILDLEIDSNNNYYFLAEVGASQTDYDGTSIQTYSVNGNRKDIFIFSTDCIGNFRWSKTIGGGIDDWATSIGTDNNNNVYVSGMTRNTQTLPVHFANDSIKNAPLNDGSLEEARKRIFIIKYDDQGNFQWLGEPEGPVDNLSGFMQKTIVEPSGRTHSLIKFGPNTHLEGQLTVPAGESQSAIVIYDNNGNIEDFFEIDMQPGFDWYDYQLAYDPNLDRYYIADTLRPSDDELSINGFGASSGDNKAFYLAALDNQGQVLWYNENDLAGSWTLGDIALDDNGDIYFTGMYVQGGGTVQDEFAGFTFTADPNEFDKRSPFLIKLDSSGNLIWGTNATLFSRFPGRSIAIKGNDVYLGLGSLNNEWDGVAFGTAVSGVGLLATDNTVLRFDKTTGALQEVISMPSQSTAFDMIMAMDIDSQGNIVVGGHFGGTLLANNPAGPITKVGGDTDFFIAQYGVDCTLGVNDIANNFGVKLYPQPAQGIVNLQSQSVLNRYKIYNLQGQSLQDGEINQDQIDVSKLSSGVYIIKVVSDDEKTQVLKLLVQ